MSNVNNTPRRREMKVKQVVSVKFDSVYSSYGSLDITDVDGGEVNIRLGDDQYIELYDSIGRKVKRILEDRADEAEKQKETTEND
tara:strand:+ start:350 stop:604 length:255 start_codon:yes stop_codon:yes gene_type:complete